MSSRVAVVGSCSVLLAIFALGGLSATGPADTQPLTTKPAETAPVPPLAPAAPDAGHNELLPNIHLAFKDVYSGGLPAGGPAFDKLKDMGIRTIICVDGGAPNVEAAESRGMRYVHIPLKYSGISASQQAELTRAVRDLPKPIYIHCHHGKHRSPAAAMMAAIGLGALSEEEGTAYLKSVGTGKNYAGLWSCVGTAKKLDAAAINAAPGEFPAVQTLPKMTERMTEIDNAFARLKAADAYGYAKTEIEGVASVADAAQIADNLRAIWQEEAKKDEKTGLGGGEMGEWCKDAAEKAQAFEDALAIDEPGKRPSVESLKASFKAVGDSCNSCHAKYRD